MCGLKEELPSKLNSESKLFFYTLLRHGLCIVITSKLSKYPNQPCLKRILNNKWQSLTLDPVLLQRTNASSIRMLLLCNQMCWAGHLTRIEDDRLVSNDFMWRLQSDRHSRHKPKKHFKDAIKASVKFLSVNVQD